MRMKPSRFGIGCLLAVALCSAVAAGQGLPLLSPGSTEEPDPVTLAAVWSADCARPGDSLVLAVVLSLQEGYHVIADAEQVRGIKDFKPFPTQVRPLSASTGVIAESPRYPEAALLNADFIDSPIPSFGGQTVVYLPVHFDTATPTGPAAVQLQVQFQACSAASCLTRRQPLEAAIAVVPAGQGTPVPIGEKARKRILTLIEKNETDEIQEEI